MTMEPKIQVLIDKFHRKMENDPEARDKVLPVKKTVTLDLGEEVYSLRIEDAKILDFKPEAIPEPDITVKTTPEVFEQLVDGTLRPMRAYMTKKITVKGKLEDIVHLKSLF